MALTSTDCLITLIYYALVLGVAYRFRSRIKTASDFFHGGRSLPTWLCVIALLASGLGLPEVITLGAAGAQFAFTAIPIYAVATVPALIFAAVFFVPVIYRSNAPSVPGYLSRRFDAKTGLLTASLFAALTLFSSAVSLSLIARILHALHIFDGIFRALGWPSQAVFIASVAVPALVVAACVAFGGLRGAIYNQLVQFLVLAAGFLPIVMLGMQKIGGLQGLKAALPIAYASTSTVSAPPDAASLVFVIALALLVGFSFWSSDLRAIQFALAAKDAQSARRVPLIAALISLALPVLFVLPGIVAIALPTPHTSTSIRYENGAIFRETTVVPPEVEMGDGLVPARVDSATGKPILDPAGHPHLNYDMATPALLLRVLPNGLLGFGLTALLAALMCGITASVTAFNTVFVRDLYQRHLRKDSTDEHYLAAGRWTAFLGVLLATVLAFVLPDFSNVAGPLLLIFSLAGVPIFAIVLLGIFWKRATGHGAFAGLLAGAAAALLHHGFTLPANTNRGSSGGWLTAAHSYPTAIVQFFSTAFAAFVVTLIVTLFVSALTKSRPAAGLPDLVR